MALGTASIAALLCFLIIQFVVLRRCREALRNGPTIKSLCQAAAVQVLRDAAAIAAFVLGLLMLALFLAEYAGIDVSQGLAREFFDYVVSARALVLAIGTWWGFVALLLLLAALVVIVFRSARSERSEPQARTIQSFLLSRRLGSVTGAGTRVLSAIGFALFILLLLATAAPNFAARLDDIIVARAIEQSERDLQFARQAASKDDGEDEDGEDEEERDDDGDGLDDALDQAARAFEDSLAQSRHFRPPPPDGPTPSTASQASEVSSRLRSHLARDEILRIAERNAPGSSHLQRQPAIWEAPGPHGDVVTRKAVELERAAARAVGPVTETGKQFRNGLAQELQAASPGLRRQFVEAIGRSRVPAETVIEIGSRLAVEVAGQLTGGAVDSDLLARVAGNAWRSALGEGVKEGTSTLMRGALSDLLNGADLSELHSRNLARAERPGIFPLPVAEALDALKGRVPRTESVWMQARVAAPSIRSTVISGDSDAAARISTELVEAAAKRGDNLAAARLSDPIAGYGDFFPGRYAEETTTRRGALLAKTLSGYGPPAEGLPGFLPPGNEPGSPTGGGGGGGGAGGGNKVTSAPADRYARSATRARSFARVRGFGRVGGVVIGQEPELAEGATADVIDLTWRIDGDGTALVLHRRDGSTLALGPYPAKLVFDAFAYGADGRPVTVTMTTAPPLADLRILLHPALLDSPVGCRAIELDRFVDTFTDRGPLDDNPIAMAERSARAQLDLYSHTQAAALRSLLDLLSQQSGLPGEIRRAEERYDRMMPRIAAVVSEAPSVGSDDFRSDPLGSLGDPSIAPIGAKREFYVDAVVDVLAQCSVHEEIAGFDSCVTSAVVSGDPSLTEILDRIDDLAKPAPRFQIWSGVRELPYAIDPALSFLQSPSDEEVGSALWPFEFILQIAFDTEPLESWAPETASASHEPWEFPSVKQQIAEAVVDGVEDGAAREIFLDMRDFTLLQRLFRAGADGLLGPDFPIWKLVDLVEETARPETFEPTPRWTTRPGRIERSLAAGLQRVRMDLPGQVDPWLQGFADRAEACITLLGTQVDPQSLSEADWNGSCGFSDLETKAQDVCDADPSDEMGCRVASVIDYASTIEKARRLRLALDLGASDALPGRTCAPL